MLNGQIYCLDKNHFSQLSFSTLLATGNCFRERIIMKREDTTNNETMEGEIRLKSSIFSHDSLTIASFKVKQ